MVVLIPTNANPTRAEIDAFIRESSSSLDHGITQITNTIREIHGKSGVGALLHPAEEYFLEAAEAAEATVARIIP
jgi:hypothetical protein